MTSTEKLMLPRVQEVANTLLNQIKFVLMAVKTCSKALFAISPSNGKSPCFLLVTFLQLVSPDYPLLVLPRVDGVKNMECAF